MKKTLAYMVIIVIVGGLLFVLGTLFNNFIGFSGYFKRTINIEKLHHKKLKFEELPEAIQGELSKILDKKGTVKEENGFLILDKNVQYEYEIVKAGPWVKYFLLKDITKGNNYQIPTSNPTPFIVYNNKLYIPREYNIIVLESIHSVKYDEYTLK